MDKLARQVDIHHAVMQGSYFAGFSAIWGFGPVLLLYHGLSNSTLGVITSLALVLPLLIQPALASLSDADPRWTSRRLALVLSLITLAAAVAMMLLPEHKTVLLVSYAVIGVTLVMLYARSAERGSAARRWSTESGERGCRLCTEGAPAPFEPN